MSRYINPPLTKPRNDIKSETVAQSNIPDSLKANYTEFIKPLKSQLDNIQFEDNKIELPTENEELTSKIQ